MNLSDMDIVVRVAQAGSMTAAARQTQRTTAAVSATVRRVETALGVRLFERTTRSLRLTDQGESVVAGCREVVARWQRVVDDAQSDHVGLSGSVHVSAPVDATYQLVGPVVAELTARHSGLNVVLHPSDHVHHLHRDAIDMAVRYGTLKDSSMTAIRLANTPRVLVASPEYLRRAGTPSAPTDLCQHACVTLSLGNGPELVWRLRSAQGVVDVDVRPRLSGDGYLARQWALEGRGIAMKSLFDVLPDLRAGRLHRVLPQYTGQGDGIHAVFPSGAFRTARVRAVQSALQQAFAEREQLCGTWLHRAD